MKKSKASSVIQFLLFSFIGVFMFFAQITIGERHALLLVAAGAVWPFVKKTWNRSVTDMIFTGFKIFGLVAAVMVCFNFGPEVILNADNGPYLFNSLVKPTALMIVIGAPLLCLLVNHGFVDFIGVFVRT